jgi:toxin ParE1/3/4
MPKTGPSLRSLPVGNYVIFYRPTQDDVEVTRVLHGTRDIDALFRAKP